MTRFDTGLQKFAQEMIASMHEAGGIGLAAQQVGRAEQVCVVDLRESEAEYCCELDGKRLPPELVMPMVIVNPKIVAKPGTKETVYEEGCLSFPEIRGDVGRPDEIAVTFQDEFGTSRRLVCDGLLSRCIQHEVDHLNGVLFIDRMEKKIRSGLDEAIRALAKQTREAGKTAL